MALELTHRHLLGQGIQTDQGIRGSRRQPDLEIAGGLKRDPVYSVLMALEGNLVLAVGDAPELNQSTPTASAQRLPVRRDTPTSQRSVVPDLGELTHNVPSQLVVEALQPLLLFQRPLLFPLHPLHSEALLGPLQTKGSNRPSCQLQLLRPFGEEPFLAALTAGAGSGRSSIATPCEDSSQTLAALVRPLPEHTDGLPVLPQSGLDLQIVGRHSVELPALL
mmetsp:Transcript_74515/g.170901  ORF Transcript_74515/g.170901 Transcript_74515/m.170901 type:complete len:221 (+) Transcript_74515:662-1324(+)